LDRIEIATLSEWRDWLASPVPDCDDVWVVIYKKASGRQTVTFDALLEEALCWGWVDTQTKSVDDERYSIRFRKRRPGSNWSATNRRIVCRLIKEGRMQPAGQALLPADLTCPP
jgi:uncharacterized protein YdeI (YjbR/CyaY-like superfamily)